MGTCFSKSKKNSYKSKSNEHVETGNLEKLSYKKENDFQHDRTEAQLRKCKVPNCKENHATHYCRNCFSQDSDHFGRNCPCPARRLKCKVSDCKEIHERHFCKNCGDEDTNHFSSQCPELVKSNSRCKVQGCTENHLKHYCRHCFNPNSDHFTSDCTILKCKVKDCLQLHKNHYCKYCQNQDSDHFSKSCEKAPQNKKCKVKGCKAPHSEHFCRFCDNDDSDHFAFNCPQAVFLFHATRLDCLEIDNGIREVGLKPINNNCRFGEGIYFADEMPAKCIKNKYGDQNGVVLKCRVFLGNMKDFGHDDDFEGEWAKTFDSCTAIHPAWHTPNEFREYVVKNPRKVKIFYLIYKGKEFKMIDYLKDKDLLENLKKNALNI